MKFIQFQTENRLNRVTTVSRYLALGLFVSLPFIGGYIGYMYATTQSIIEAEEIITINATEEEVKNGTLTEETQNITGFKELENITASTSSILQKQFDSTFSAISFKYPETWNCFDKNPNYQPEQPRVHIQCTVNGEEVFNIFDIARSEMIFDANKWVMMELRTTSYYTREVHKLLQKNQDLEVVYRFHKDGQNYQALGKSFGLENSDNRSIFLETDAVIQSIFIDESGGESLNFSQIY